MTKARSLPILVILSASIPLALGGTIARGQPAHPGAPESDDRPYLAGGGPAAQPSAWAAPGLIAEPGNPAFDASSVEDLQHRMDAFEQRLDRYETGALYGLDEAPFPDVRLHGRVYNDWAWFHQNEANRDTVGDIQDGVGFRTARLSGEGRLRENVWCEVEFDFAESGDAPEFKDVWIEVTELPIVGNVRIGHFKEPFSLEQLTSSRFISFMERGLPNALVPGRSVGIAAYDCSAGRRVTWAVGAFRTDADDWGGAISDHGQWAATLRATMLPYFADDGRRLIHAGASYSYRRPDDDRLRFRSRPEINVKSESEKVPWFVNTKNFPASDFHLFGVEAAWVRGPLSVQSEFVGAGGSQLGGPDLFFYGAYAYVSYFLTGETRPYDRTLGEFERVVPFRDFLRLRRGDGIVGGSGAWELAARWSYLELNDGDVEGGRLGNWTLGLNWHLNPYARFMFNYIDAHLDDFSDGDSSAKTYAMRFQFDF